MRSPFPRFIVFIVVLAAIGVFAWTARAALFSAPDDSEVSVPDSVAGREPSKNVADASKPDRLQIPSLNIDAHVQYVGLGKTGNMAVPSNYTDVGWYRYGTVPGALGSAVIDGHVDNGLGFPGVFSRLQDIRIGDDVYIRKNGGEALHFKVVDKKTYPYKSVPSEMLFDRDDAARLNIITCEGSWVKGDKTYDHRIVVYTKLVGQN